MPSGGARKGTGPKPKEIDLKVLEALRRVGATQAEIAAQFDMTENAFEKRKAKSRDIQEIMEYAAARGNLSLRRRLHIRAHEGSDACLIFLAKNCLGLTDRVRTEISGPEGKPIEVDNKASAEIVADMIRMLEANKTALV
jgi:hypothetical protein